MLFTDMAVELIPAKSRKLSERIKRTDISLDAPSAAKLKRAPGEYITVESDIISMCERGQYRRLIEAVTQAIRELLPSCKSILVAALGNPEMTADALGARCAKRIGATRHLTGGKQREISIVIPNVMGTTGIESAQIVLGAVRCVKPDAVIAIDSLASAATERLAAAFQLTDTGITPGSGLDNHRMQLNSETMGVKVIGIGVPLVVYASTIVAEAGGTADDKLRRLVVTPKDIDVLVDDCAYVIAESINAIAAAE